MGQQSELGEARKRRLEELQRALGQQEAQQDDAAEQVGALEAFVKSKLTGDAAARYTNLKLAYPEKAMQLLTILGQAIGDYKIKQVDDAQLKDLLQRMTPAKKEFKITRK
jgi:programmed cell death protein 5